MFNLKTLSAAVASALVFSNAWAAGLGKLTVLSSLGQPLRAEIELTAVSKDEVGALTAKLATADAFRQANIDFHPALSTLRFAVEQRGDRQFIRMTSSQPLNEPFVDMLLELAGPNGRLVREYTFLLDPADLRTTQSAQVAPMPVPESAAPAAQPRAQAPAESAPAPRASSQTRVQRAEPAPRVARPAAALVEGDPVQGEYRVRSGDTLARIAGQVKPGGVSLDQMLVALYQSNPDAFVGNNMNRLKAGQILSVPDAEKARSISQSEAHGIVVAQSADFSNYRNKLAGKVAEAAPQKSAEAKQSAGGKITAKVEEKPTPASESKDKLKLSNAQAAQGGAADKAAPATQEDKIARDKAIADANARVKELEKNVGELQKLLEVKNKALSDQQKQADATAAAAKAEAAKPAPTAPAPMETKPAEAKVEKPAEPKAAEKPAVQATPPVAAAPAPAPQKPKAVTPPPAPAQEEPSFLDDLLGNPLVLPGVGALLVALGALGVYRARRQKQSKQFEDSIITDTSLKANSLFGSTGGQSVDTNNSVFNSNFAPSASQLDSNEVDPVAEADVYIAYGRDAQAEEILKEALRTQPDRHAVRVKLLEIYSNRKDLRAFEVLATELYGLTRGEGEDWKQAASMGVAIDPNNPLYASGNTEVADDVPLIAPTQPLDEQGLATLLSSTQSDTTQLETIDGLDADASYFNNTELAADAASAPAEAPPVEPEPEHKVTSNDLDFDLDGMQDLTPPNTIPRPVPAEPPADLTSIDFNFLDEPVKPAEPEEAAVPDLMAASEPVVEPEPVASIPAIDDLEFPLDDKPAETDAPVAMVEDISLDALAPPVEADVPDIGDLTLPGEEPKVEAPAADPLDFDLSGISLELNSPEPATEALPPVDEVVPAPVADFDSLETEPVAAAPTEAPASLELPDLDFDAMNTQMLTDDPDANSAEMATKLDLAIAYQEIGDKEGARELLDEVLKGGTPEQSERAKALLLELA
ncbi:FimV/HubP family polar landmark protein [Noviherbaspirillum denitrificans]|nr:FimV/HubP family polar landmark protein [Noviherbaspirillum denitrificans]